MFIERAPEPEHWEIVAEAKRVEWLLEYLKQYGPPDEPGEAVDGKVVVNRTRAEDDEHG
jgi:hypothetical protein